MDILEWFEWLEMLNLLGYFPGNVWEMLGKCYQTEKINKKKSIKQLAKMTYKNINTQKP